MRDPRGSTRADFSYDVPSERKGFVPPAGLDSDPATPVRSTTFGRPSTSADGDHAQQPGRAPRRLRPDRPGGRGSETPALAERRELPPVPRLSFRMRAMTQTASRNIEPRTACLSSYHRAASASSDEASGPIGPPASLLETVSDAIANRGAVLGRCFPREDPRRPSLEFGGPDCANRRRVVHNRRVEAGQELGGDVGTILVAQCQSVPQDRFGLGGHDPIVRAAEAKRVPLHCPRGQDRSCQFGVESRPRWRGGLAAHHIGRPGYPIRYDTVPPSGSRPGSATR